MKVKYKGFDIEAKREKCLGGWDVVSYSVFSSEGYEVTSGVSDAEDPISIFIRDLKSLVDEYIKDPEQFE